MDALARALLSAADILEKSELPEMLKERYASFDTGEGKRFEDGQMSLEELVAYAKSHGEPATISGKQEKYEAIVALHVK
jgi:xylose isomerase